MYGGNTNAQNLVLQPAPDGGWEATTKVDIALAEKTYEQAALMVYGSDQDFAKLSFIKVPEGRNLEFILQQGMRDVAGKLGIAWTRTTCSAAALARARVWRLTLGRDLDQNWATLLPLLSESRSSTSAV